MFCIVSTTLAVPQRTAPGPANMLLYSFIFSRACSEPEKNPICIIIYQCIVDQVHFMRGRIIEAFVAITNDIGIAGFVPLLNLVTDNNRQSTVRHINLTA